MAEEGAQWCLIESDPLLLTDLLGRIGVRGVQVEELFAASVDELERLDPLAYSGSMHSQYSLDSLRRSSGHQERQMVYGLIFLFKHGGEKSSNLEPIKHTVEGLYFAQQMVTNACATQAIMNIIMNVENLDLGPELSEFKSFSIALPADMKGMAIGQSDTIRTVHNSYGRQELFSMEGPQDSDQDAFHFLAYVPFGGRLYELDGLNQGPVDHGPIDGDKWYAVAEKAVQDRIAKFGSDEIRFNLCALVQDRKELYTAQLEKEKAATEPNAFRIQELEDKMAAEMAKKKQFVKEAARRKHNYIPFILKTLEALAEKGSLAAIVEEAKKKQKSRIEAKKARQAQKGNPSS